MSTATFAGAVAVLSVVVMILFVILMTVIIYAYRKVLSYTIIN